MGRGVGDIPSDMLQGFGTPEDTEEEGPPGEEERVATENVHAVVDRRRAPVAVKPGEAPAPIEAPVAVKPGEAPAPIEAPAAQTPGAPSEPKIERRRQQVDAERWAREERRAERFAYELEEA